MFLLNRPSSGIVPLKPKHLKKIKGSQGVKFKVPDTWPEFAKMCRIRSGLKFIPFLPYDYQIELIKLIEVRQYTIVAKTRQLGISETICNYFVWKALRNPAYVAVILSRTQADTTALCTRIKKQLLPFTNRGLITFEVDNVTSLEIAGAGKLLFRNSSENGARGLESISDVLCDEWAFCEFAAEIWTAVIPTIELTGKDARVIVVSTPNGRVGAFWELMNNGNGRNDVVTWSELIREGYTEPFQHWVDFSGWNKVLLHWKAHPIFSQIKDFVQQKVIKSKLTPEAAAREYDLNWDESDQSVFSYHLIEAAAIGEFCPPDESKRYYMGIDCSTIGDDYFVGTILGESNGHYSTDAQYRDRKKTMNQNLKGLSDLIELYRPERVGIEVTGGIGQLYLEKLAEKFPSVTFIAINTSEASKPILLARSIMAHEEGAISYPAGIVSDEHQSFIRSGKKPGASGSGNHDDTVMAECFALAVSNYGNNEPDDLAITTFRRG